ncbi:unnamed protein product [Gordionus sp. m RMFG-2023]
MHRAGVKLEITGCNPQNLPEGTIFLTNYHIIWKPPFNLKECLGSHQNSNDIRANHDLIIPLSRIILAEEDLNMGTSSIVIHCYSNSLIKLHFGLSGQVEFLRQLQKQLSDKCWLLLSSITNQHLLITCNKNTKFKSSGITSIENRFSQTEKHIYDNISQSFSDLSSLKDHAIDTVHLCRSIANQLIEKTGNLSEDEITVFKSHLLSLGLEIEEIKNIKIVIPNSSTNISNFHKKLAIEIIQIILPTLEIDYVQNLDDKQSFRENTSLFNGFMTLPEAFCRVNRAKGLDLISLEDMLTACLQINNISFDLNVKNLDALHIMKSGLDNFRLVYKSFDSGLSVLCLDILLRIDNKDINYNNDILGLYRESNSYPVICQIYQAMVKFAIENDKNIESKNLSITPEKMAQIYSIPVFIAKERLMIAENIGYLCRDDSIEGLQFFLNLIYDMY